MSDVPTLTCSRCGASFTPRAELLERYPGWRPSTCPSCYRASRRSSAAAGERATSGTAGRGGGATSGAARRGGARRRGPVEDNLTRREVLARYTGGPQDGVFTDGSATPNPGPGGWGAVYVRDGEVVAEDHGSEPSTTNNRMELTALLRGIELVPVGTEATIHTDSNLAVRTLTEWAAGWEARGWKRRTGAVENLDLVRPLHELLRSRPELELVWIKAHAGNRWNEYADSLSTAYLREEL